ncbi:MAG: hypothetical protein ACXAEX_04715 [Promethearchaeota archaeon]|jgi:hypothetical protein
MSQINTKGVDLLSMEILGSSKFPIKCVFCGQSEYFLKYPDGRIRRVDAISGPFYHYEQRKSDLYFDLDDKYFHCFNCGKDFHVLDFEVLVEGLSSKLPPEFARHFSMRTFKLFEKFPEIVKDLVLTVMDDFQQDLIVTND